MDAPRTVVTRMLPDLARWPLAWRLLLPLAALAVLFGGAFASFLVDDVSARMDREMDDRLERLANGLLASGFALDERLLARVRAVSAAEVLTVSQGEVRASTLPPPRARAFLPSLPPAGRARYAQVQGERYRLVARPIASNGRDHGSLLVVASSTLANDQLKRGIAWRIVGATVTGLLLLAVIGQLVVRTATRPLGELAEAARRIGEGASGHTVPRGGGPEIDVMAREFNAMLDALERSREELVRAEKLAVAGTMAASVAHEIRNPLSSIRMNVQLLARQARAPEVERELLDVLDEVDRLELVLGNLLDLTAAPSFRPSRHDVNAVLEVVLRLTARKLAHVGVEVRKDLDPGLPPLFLDDARVKQAFLNVVLNATEAMPGGGCLRVASRRRGPLAEIVFEDTGHGLTADLERRALEPFVTSKTGGTGLGLHIVKTVVALHGGSVRFEPSTTTGTCCVLAFPIGNEPAMAVAGAGRSAC